jgi:hypothetical protein
MRIKVRLALTAAVIFVNAQAIAVDTISHSASPRRQLIACMNKRMSASRSISYNEASKVCKDQLKADGATLASTAPVKPISGVSQSKMAAP